MKQDRSTGTEAKSSENRNRLLEIVADQSAGERATIRAFDEGPIARRQRAAVAKTMAALRAAWPERGRSLTLHIVQW